MPLIWERSPRRPRLWFRVPVKTTFRSSELPELRLALAVRSQSRVLRAIRVLSGPATPALSRRSPTEDGSPAEVGELILVFPRRAFGELALFRPRRAATARPHFCSGLFTSNSGCKRSGQRKFLPDVFGAVFIGKMGV